MEGEGEPSVQAVQSHICTRWTRPTRLGKRLQRCSLWLGLPGQDARQWGSRSGCSFTQDEERNRPGSTRHHSHRPGSIRALPLAHDDGDERGGLSSFPRRSGFNRQPVGPAVEGFAERFTEAQKSSQAMRHFLPKCTSSSSASSRPKSVPTQQTAKPAPTTPEPRPPEGLRDRGLSSSVRRYNFTKCQGPRPRSPWIQRLRSPGHSSRHGADDSNCLNGASHENSAPPGFLQERHRPSAQSFPEDAGPYGSGIRQYSVESASYATHPVLVETEGSIHGLASRMQYSFPYLREPRLR